MIDIQAGDETAFAAAVERYRGELHVHCYRMLGSLEDAEDLVQETFLRAWSKRASFEGRSTLRAWLYRIATNAKELPASDARAPAGAEDALLRRLMDAWERADAGTLAALLREDARLTMPPTTSWYDGRDAIATFFAEHAFGPTSPGEMRVVATAANRQPAVAVYLRRPGDSEHRAFALTLLRVERGAIAELTLFHLPELFA